MSSKLVPIHVTPNHEVIEASGVGNLLDRIRPEWKAKQLVQRVTKLLHADPSSACQRIFNASIHDLKEKIVIAGDLAPLLRDVQALLDIAGVFSKSGMSLSEGDLTG